MRTRSPHTATAIAAGLVLLGAVLLFLGWKGAAATLFVPTQLAFGFSGSMLGLCLVGTGLAVLAVQTTRLATARRTRDLQHLVGDAVDLLVAVRDRTADGTRKLESPVTSSWAPTPELVPSSNGQTPAPVPAMAGGPADHTPWMPEVLLMPGAKTFHSTDCRIVADNSQALRLTVEEATSAGLRPCRICGGNKT